jgi:hypothetical protein
MPVIEIVSEAEDGLIQGSSTVSSGNAHNTSTGSDDADSSERVGQVVSNSGGTVTRIWYRLFLRFATSGIFTPSAQINSINLRLTRNSINSGCNDTCIVPIVQIAQYDWAATLATAREVDYDGALSAAVAESYLWAQADSATLQTPYESEEALPAGWLNLSGDTNLALLTTRDIANTPFTAPGVGDSRHAQVQIYLADEATAAWRPTLVIDYTPAAGYPKSIMYFALNGWKKIGGILRPPGYGKLGAEGLAI